MHYNGAKANDSVNKDRRKVLRKDATPAEVVLWQIMRKRGVGGYKFRRQQGIGPYILDFYCADLRLCVELDGHSHWMKNEYDLKRTQYLNSVGIRVIRFSNDHVLSNVESVRSEILRAAQKIVGKSSTPPLTPPLPGEGNGSGNPPPGEGNGGCNPPPGEGNGGGNPPPLIGEGLGEGSSPSKSMQ